MRWLLRPSANTRADNNRRLIVCTGERMEELVTTKLYKSLGVRTTDYEVVHARGLSNEFYCYANFEVEGEGGWKWKAPES